LHSPYASFQTHRKYQKALRQFVDDVITPDAASNGPRGKRPSAEVNEKIAYVDTTLLYTPRPLIQLVNSELNLFAMALGPGKHLKGLKLMGGLITPEEVCLLLFVVLCPTISHENTQFDPFHELISSQEFVRCRDRGYGDGQALSRSSCYLD